MKKIIAIVVGIAFAFGTAGFSAAQAPTTAPAPKAEDKMDKKAAATTRRRRQEGGCRQEGADKKA